MWKEGDDTEEYVFETAKADDVDGIFTLFEKRVKWMDEVGIRQWNATDYLNVYPKSYYRSHAARGMLFVMRSAQSGRAVCAAVLLTEDPRWDGHSEKKAYYVHNLVTDTAVKGVGAGMIANLEKYAVEHGAEYMRLDCAVDNAFLNKYYTGLGYQMAGTCVDGAYRGNLREKELKGASA